MALSIDEFNALLNEDLDKAHDAIVSWQAELLKGVEAQDLDHDAWQVLLECDRLHTIRRQDVYEAERTKRALRDPE